MILSPASIKPYSLIVCPTWRSSRVCNCSVASSNLGSIVWKRVVGDMEAYSTRSIVLLSNPHIDDVAAAGSYLEGRDNVLVQSTRPSSMLDLLYFSRCIMSGGSYA